MNKIIKMVRIDWHEKDKSVKLVKHNGSEMILCVGEFITYEGRDEGVRIEGFLGKDGPIGMVYLPWRGNRWATTVFTLRGNPRFIICYPHGNSVYGQHIDWNTVEHEMIPDLL